MMTEPLSKEQFDAIRARADAATPGPWNAHNRSSDGVEDEFLGFDIDGPPDAMRGQFARRADAEFLAHARTDIPALLAHIDAQSAAIALLREQMSMAAEYCTEICRLANAGSLYGDAGHISDLARLAGKHLLARFDEDLD